jgi:hypothetical protein
MIYTTFFILGVVLNYTIPCVTSWIAENDHNELLKCVDNLNINNISNIACP